MDLLEPSLDQEFGLAPDADLRTHWTRTLAQLQAQLVPLVSTTLHPPSEFQRLSALAHAVASAQQVLDSLGHDPLP